MACRSGQKRELESQPPSQQPAWCQVQQIKGLAGCRVKLGVLLRPECRKGVRKGHALGLTVSQSSFGKQPLCLSTRISKLYDADPAKADTPAICAPPYQQEKRPCTSRAHPDTEARNSPAEIGSLAAVRCRKGTHRKISQVQHRFTSPRAIAVQEVHLGRAEYRFLQFRSGTYGLRERWRCTMSNGQFLFRKPMLHPAEVRARCIAWNAPAFLTCAPS